MPRDPSRRASNKAVVTCIMQLKGKKILLAVTGSIAAYKTPQLVRLLVKAGAEVRVIMTEAAAGFITPLSLSTVSRHPVFASVHDGAAWNNHVELGRWADVMLIAPCSANTLAKLANGLCDNLVCAVYLSATCPVFIAPAMDEDMWAHPASRANLAKLREWGNHLIPVGHGELASGLVGEGRMAEPEDLAQRLEWFLSAQAPQPLAGLRALVTAGPTYERLDPVRFIGNFSSGKMGIAIAETLARKGAQVELILGPSQLRPSHPGITVHSVESAADMFDQASRIFPDCSIAVMAAAVADFRPSVTHPEKIKKGDGTLDLTLEKTVDILKTLGSRKQPGQTLVGFALETSDEHANAMLKLHGKNADMIVLNSLRDEGAGFGHDTNKITILRADGKLRNLPLQSKNEAAAAVVQAILEYRHEPQAV